jgi:hypothetical protein
MDRGAVEDQSYREHWRRSLGDRHAIGRQSGSTLFDADFEERRQ